MDRLAELLKTENCRVSLGDKWLVFDGDEWLVLRRRYGAKKNEILYRGIFLTKAIEKLKED